MIYNSSAYEKESNEKIRDFLKYIYTNEPEEDDFSKRISAMVGKIKDNDMNFIICGADFSPQIIISC